MKVPTLGLLASLLAVVYGQSSTDCPADLLATDDCAAIINPIACYNQMRWSARTLTCIEGTSDADRKKKACKCCSCIGAVMCNWTKTQKYC